MGSDSAGYGLTVGVGAGVHIVALTFAGQYNF